jgi:ATP-dependent Clp protease ATP-binding subunit ClpC
VGWERWTPRAQRVVSELAPAAAEELGHQNFVGTEHLLIALIEEGAGVAAVALRQLGVERDAVVAAVRAKVPPATGKGGFTPRAWTVMSSCIQEALKLGHNYIGTEHVLLALLNDDGVAAQVLSDLHVDHAAGTAKVVALLQQGPSART